MKKNEKKMQIMHKLSSFHPFLISEGGHRWGWEKSAQDAPVRKNLLSIFSSSVSLKYPQISVNNPQFSSDSPH